MLLDTCAEIGGWSFFPLGEDTQGAAQRRRFKMLRKDDKNVTSCYDLKKTDILQKCSRMWSVLQELHRSFSA